MFDTYQPERAPDVPLPKMQISLGGLDAGLSSTSCGALARCQSCVLRGRCMMGSLPEGGAGLIDAIGLGWRTVHRGSALYRSGDAFQSVYSVRSGSFKTVTAQADGVEQVTGFQLAGDMLGLGSIAEGTYDSDAIALEDSVVCVLPLPVLEAMCRESKSLQQHFNRTLSSEITREMHHLLLLASKGSDQRVTSFLLNLSRRMGVLGYSRTEFTLRLTREEIGSYLGIKLETVSRALSQLQREGFIHVQGKQITLLDPDAMGADLM